MNKEINYPIKYAVLELKERGGYQSGYEDIIQGYIVSKCYVIESSIVYNSDGGNKVIHKVVFPFRNIGDFKQSLRNGGQNIGNADVPTYDACGLIYPINIVNDLFDSYDAAKVSAEEKNEKYKHKIGLEVPELLYSQSSPATWNDHFINYINWQKRCNEAMRGFENGLKTCNLFEQLVLEATEDMKISEEIASDRIRVLKPVRKK